MKIHINPVIKHNNKNPNNKYFSLILKKFFFINKYKINKKQINKTILKILMPILMLFS